jgi:hypothetical protein
LGRLNFVQKVRAHESDLRRTAIVFLTC